MEDISSTEGFLEVSERYLENASPLKTTWGGWLLLAIVLILAIGSFFWLRSKKKEEKDEIQD